MTDARNLLNTYANEFPYSGINRANAAPSTFAGLRAVLDIHEPVTIEGKKYCGCCRRPTYPCDTVKAITTALEDR